MSSAPQPQAAATGSTLEELRAFPAMSLSAQVAAFGGDQDLEPPDTQVAAGPTYLVEALNDTLTVWSRSGGLVSKLDLNAFFPVPNGYGVSDPRVAYDPASGRWFLSALDVDSAGDSDVYLAVSTSSDPTSTWTIYTLGTATGTTMDQPKLGFASDVVVVSWNDFSASSGAFDGAETDVVDKPSLLGGQSNVAVSSFGPDTARFDLVPAVSETATGTEYLAYNNSCPTSSQPDTTGSCETGSSAIGVVALTGTPATNNVVWSESDPAMPSTQNPPSPDQPSRPGSIAADEDDDRFLAATYSAGALYISGNDACVPKGDSVSRACGRLLEVTGLSAPAVALDTDLGLAGQAIYYPALAPDANGNLLIAASQSSTTTYPEAVAFALPSGSSSASETVIQGSSADYSGERWGDYSGAAVDPNNTGDVVVAAEYATSSSGWNWGTAIGDVTLAAPTVTGISPASGPSAGGTTVTVTGRDFPPGATVNFGSSAASRVSVASPTQLSAVAPAHSAGTVAVTVTTPDGTSASTAADSFTYTGSSGPATNVAVSLSPNSIAANGSSTSTATATVTDAAGGAVAGDHVSFSSTDAANRIGAVTDKGNGTYAATITSSRAVHAVTVTATDSSVSPSVSGQATLTQTAGPSLTAVDGPNNSLLVQAPQLPAGWHDLGGYILAAPAVAAIPASAGGYARPLFVAVGGDHSLWVRSLTAGWQQLAPAYCLDNPAALVVGSTFYIACQGSNHALWYGKTTLPASGLPHIGGLYSLGGVLSAGPALAPVGGTVTFFVSGSNHELYTRSLSSGYVAHSFLCYGHPAAGVAPGSSTTYAACDGSGGALYVMTNSGNGWSVSVNYGGWITDGPGLAATSAGVFFWTQSPSGGGLWVAGAPNNWSYANTGGIQHGAQAAGVG